MEFEWDKNKAVSNLSKHGVSFDEARTVFDDTLYIDFYDPDHSYGQLPKSKDLGLCEAYTKRSLHKLNR